MSRLSALAACVVLAAYAAAEGEKAAEPRPKQAPAAEAPSVPGTAPQGYKAEPAPKEEARPGPTPVQGQGRPATGAGIREEKPSVPAASVERSTAAAEALEEDAEGAKDRKKAAKKKAKKRQDRPHRGYTGDPAQDGGSKTAEKEAVHAEDPADRGQGQGQDSGGQGQGQDGQGPRSGAPTVSPGPQGGAAPVRGAAPSTGAAERK